MTSSIQLPTASTLAELLTLRRRLTPAGEAYREFDAAAGAWVSLTWEEFAERVWKSRNALRAEGLRKGARVAILVPNGIEHLCMDQAALSIGLVPVPMHVIDLPESLAYVLADSGASLLLIDSASRWRTLEPLAARFPLLQRVVCVSGSVPTPSGIARSLAAWLAGEGNPARHARRPFESAPVDPDSEPAPDDLAAIVYTSGTTGRPKGVMLSHRNVVSNVYALMANVPVLESDLFLSFLPLSHTLERTAGYYLPMAAGATVAFARSVRELMSDLATVRPTVLISVPRIYERAYAAIRESLAHHPLSRAAFALTVSVGWRRLHHAGRRSSRAPLFSRLVWPLLDRVIASHVRERFGGRLRAAVTGGAPIPQAVARAFLALGVPLLQGYGLTESSPVISAGRLGEAELDSVGWPLPGVELKLGERGELMARSASVMRGYWGRPEDTERALEPDGWLHTGDQASIEGGRLYIRGRIKDIIVTSTGEKIAPADVESAILTDPLFDQVMVLGEARPYVAALAVLNREQWAREAARLGLTADDPQSLASRAALDRALERIARATRGLPAYATPRAVSLSLESWTVDAGLMTPTLKPKRPALEQRFSAEIAALYRGHAA